jgi:hypothetical protein
MCQTATDDDLVRLNRKMFVSSSRGTVLGAHLFEINDQELVKQFNGWSKHLNFKKVDHWSTWK